MPEEVSGRRRDEEQAAFEAARYERLLDELARNGFIDAIPTMEFLFRRDCPCACHPSLGTHDHGTYGCSCEQTPEQRRAAWKDRERDLEEWWASDEYRALRQADEANLREAAEWASTNGVVADRSSVACPEQWVGTVDDVPFYFRERHGSWRVEVEATLAARGPVVAEGHDSDYTNAVELLTLVADAVRLHVLRQNCGHPAARAFCADCGQRMTD